MKNIIYLVMLFALPVFAQFQDSTAAVIDSNATASVWVDVGTHKLLSIHFPATVTSDTFFVQTTADTIGGGLAKDVYITTTGSAQARLIILSQASSICGLNPLGSDVLKRYVRVIADDAEGDVRTLYFNY